ncbi:MAG: hypothetical protein PHO37_15880 [Kiritimatiellae bacterium]|nr:hypothetical protein [Kiritimatiellia bacterium]
MKQLADTWSLFAKGAPRGFMIFVWLTEPTLHIATRMKLGGRGPVRMRHPAVTTRATLLRELWRLMTAATMLVVVDESTHDPNYLSTSSHSYPGVALKKNEAPGVCSLGYWRSIGEQRRGLCAHRNEGVELTMSLSGITPVTVEGKEYSLQPGELLVTRPWQLHSIGSPIFAAGKVGWLIIDVGVRHPHQEWQWPKWVVLSKGEMQFLTRGLRQNEDVVRAVPETLAKTFEQLVRIATHPDAPHRGSRIVVAVNALLLELFELSAGRIT